MMFQKGATACTGMFFAGKLGAQYTKLLHVHHTAYSEGLTLYEPCC